MPVLSCIRGILRGQKNVKKAEQQLTKSLSELSLLAKEYSVRYFIENMGNWEYFFLKTPDELPLIGDIPFALDVGHAHQNHCLAEFLSFPPPIITFMITMARKIRILLSEKVP